MSQSQGEPPEPAECKPAIRCLPLPPFEAGDLKAVQRVFRHATPCPLHQAWLAKAEVLSKPCRSRRKEAWFSAVSKPPYVGSYSFESASTEPNFAPGVVRIGWRSDSLLVLAELTDADIFTQATSNNQRFWELGDTFELFLRPVEQLAYFEFHVTPNNCRLQARFADAEMHQRLAQTGAFEEALMAGELFASKTWVRAETRQWFVFAEIPASSVCEPARPLAGSEWRFSFSRYDYTRGQAEPVISSTSPHSQPNFHRQEEWGVITFTNRAAA